MKCEECELLIEEYADGELERSVAAKVEAHLATCAACFAYAEDLQRELNAYARYEREVEVTPALWAAVETRIKQERVVHKVGLFARVRESLAGMFATPRLSPAFAAMIVLVAVGLTLFLTNYINSRKDNGAGGEVATVEKPAPPPVAPPTQAEQPGAVKQGEQVATTPDVKEVKPQAGDDVKEKVNAAPARQLNAKAQAPSADQLVKEAEQKYLAAINILQRDVNRGTRLDPSVRARFEVALAEIDRTITETRQIVRKNPGDPSALQYLLGAYSKKVDVLREMSRQSAAEDQ